MSSFADPNSKTAQGYTELDASSLAVGLPEGLMGNSEVGHLNIGAGRVVWQDSVRIDQTLKNGKLGEIENIRKSFQRAKDGNGRLHLLGLVSDGGVHSQNKHLYGLLQVAKDIGVPKVIIHFFGDGRDTDPKSSSKYMQELLDKTKELGIGELGTVVGRYYVMDRDKRWERVEIGMKGIVTGEGEDSTDPVKTIEERYAKGENDEFLKPIILGGKENRVQGRSSQHSEEDRLTYGRQRHTLLLQLPIRPCPRNHPAPWRLRPLSQARLPLPQGHSHHHHDSIQDRLHLPHRFPSPTHGQRPRRMARQEEHKPEPHCRNRKIRTRHILLQRRYRETIPRRRA